jgi:hypothetical protein
LVSDVFLDSRGRLEGEQLVGRDISPLHCLPLVVHLDSRSRARSNHGCRLAIITAPSTNPAAWTTPRDWKDVVRESLTQGYVDVHIFLRRGSLLATEGMIFFSAFTMPHDIDTIVLASDPPPPPTSERPRYRVLYTTIDMLNDDILLAVFNYYRLDNEINWNARLVWCKLSHVYRRWRHLVYGSVFHLVMHILCTNGTPLVDTLVHLPPLPLVVDYQYATATIGAQDESGIFHALQLRDRLRHVVLRIPSSILDQLLMLMDESFPVLEHLSLSSTAEEGTILLLPETFIAPNLRHLTLLGIGLPKQLLLLSSTVSLVTLTLTNIRDFSYFLPQHLVTRLRYLSQLEELTIGFSVPLPRPSAEKELTQEIEAPVTLPLLKRLTFRGVCAYLDSLIAPIRAPLLEQLSITLFNQISFVLPHLSDFTNTTEGLKLPIAKIIFKHDAVSIVTDHRRQQTGDVIPSFSLHVISKQFDWQMDSATQICSALMDTLSGIEQLTLDFEGQGMSAEWQDDAVDGATWRELLGPFIGAKELRICHALAWELSCALQSLADVGLDPGLLPGLEELATELEVEHAGNAFASFIEARQVAGRPVLLLPLPVCEQPVCEQPAPFLLRGLPEHYPLPPSKQGSWLRRSIFNPIRKRLG